MLMPKRVLHRKVQRGKRRGQPYRGSRINFGEYGLQSMECGWITSRQIESARGCDNAPCSARRQSLD